MNRLRKWAADRAIPIWIVGILLASWLYPLMPLDVFKNVEYTWGSTPLEGRIIVVDPGHGGVDGGAIGIGGLFEKDVTLKIGLYLRELLRGSGAYVVLTREQDKDLSNPLTIKLRRKKEEDLAKRVRLVNDLKADALVSVHLNSIPHCSYCRGGQTFYNPTLEENKNLAFQIQSSLVRNLENTKRIPNQKSDIFILRNSRIPTALVEVGFLSHPHEVSLLQDEEYQKKVATAIYYGILGYFDALKKNS